MPFLLVSSCLLGHPVRYNGCCAGEVHPLLIRWMEEGRVLPLCPEVDGGLPVPRIPAEIEGGRGGLCVLRGEARVLDVSGACVSAAFIRGAQYAVDVARAHGIRIAILKEGSPSCGSGYIYDGSFRGTRIPSVGVTTAALQVAGIQVFSEARIPEVAAYLKQMGAET